MSKISRFLEISNAGGSVYMHDVKAAFNKEHEKFTLVLHLLNGGLRVFDIPMPEPKTKEDERFLQDYFYGRVYNILSMLGGVKMDVYCGSSKYLKDLAEGLIAAFGVNVPRLKREGYAKCLNVADRMNLALGAAQFSFELFDGAANIKEQPEEVLLTDVVSGFKKAADRAMHGCFTGIDIGGTDIKLVGVNNGRLDHIKEYDWNPSSFKTIDCLTSVVLLLARMSRALLSLPIELSQEAQKLRKAVLEKDAPFETMIGDVVRLETLAGELKGVDGIGVSFPDVVVRDRIVGGETHKTKGVREHSKDYESEFKSLTALNCSLSEYCSANGKVHITNDGPMSAYTAAVELAHSDKALSVSAGMFAHSLGTELGTGWVDEEGKVPEYPLEVYNCIIDLGNAPAAGYEAADVRSLNNFNTGLAGTLQRFTGQSGAFRLAEEYYKSTAPNEYAALFEKGFITKTEKGLVASIAPVDMRKAFLEHLMAQAEQGMPEAMEIFRTIGKCLAATWLETDEVLRPKCKSRVLFGRFVKKNAVFALMNEGATELLPNLTLLAADESLAYTKLMCELRDSKEYTVAQFGQAVGSVYFAASML